MLSRLIPGLILCSALAFVSCNVHEKEGGSANSAEDNEVLLRVFSGECFTTPTLFTITEGEMVVERDMFDHPLLDGAKGSVLCTFLQPNYTYLTTGENVSGENPNVSVVRSDEFWYPEDVSETKADALLGESN